MRQAMLKEHADDDYHGQAAIRDLGAQLVGLPHRVRRGQHPEADFILRLVLSDLAEGHVIKDLPPCSCRHLEDGLETARHVHKFFVGHDCKHTDASMPHLSLPASMAVLSAASNCKASGIPEAHGSFGTKLTLEGTEGNMRVESPIAPGAASEAILEGHADDGHHCQTAISALGIVLLDLLRWVAGQHLEGEVSCGNGSSWVLFLRHFAIFHVEQIVCPSSYL
mmetsp:Transcript_67777/g.147635  ORF Transcript_67777/g.147635 Transcript_67777/m.147635 type:complete len:223 (+) Transcript_67777:318-986(+)